MHVNEREWYANFSACLLSFRRKRLHNVAGEWENANAPTGILTACRRNKKGYASRKSVALYAVEKEQSADEPGSVLCVAKCSSFIWMRRCRHILSFYPPTFLRRESNEPPSNVGLHELSASEVHGLPRHHGNRWALTPPSHPYRRAVRNLAAAVLFFCTNSPSQTTSH